MNQDVYEMYQHLTPENKQKIQELISELLAKQRKGAKSS